MQVYVISALNNKKLKDIQQRKHFGMGSPLGQNITDLNN